jgi:hypothetical protein
MQSKGLWNEFANHRWTVSSESQANQESASESPTIQRLTTYDVVADHCLPADGLRAGRFAC